MLEQPMIDRLLALRLHGMVEAWRQQQQDPSSAELSFAERLALMVDHQWNWKENQALTRRLRSAKLRAQACPEDIDYRTPRGLNKSVVRALLQDSAWVRNHENLFVIGPCGVGKSFLACALSHKVLARIRKRGFLIERRPKDAVASLDGGGEAVYRARSRR